MQSVHYNFESVNKNVEYWISYDSTQWMVKYRSENSIAQRVDHSLKAQDNRQSEQYI